MENEHLITAAGMIYQSLVAAGFSDCYIMGGLAVSRFGQPRATSDVDITLMARFGNELETANGVFNQTLLSPRIEAAIEFGGRHRVLLCQTDSGVEVDICLGALPFEINSIERATNWKILNTNFKTCCAEDLLVHKLLAGRPQDWIDIESILTRQSGRLDFSLIQKEALPLLELKQAVEDFDRFKLLYSQLNQS